jgi:hypothetical protein
MSSVAKQGSHNPDRDMSERADLHRLMLKWEPPFNEEGENALDTL